MALQANKTSATTVTFTNPQEIVISHLDDSIKIGDGTQVFTGGQKTAAASLPVVLASDQSALPVNVALDAADGDSVKISDGTNDVAVNTDGSLNVISPTKATRLDEATSTVTYVGKAAVGTGAASASWQIYRLTLSGSETIIEYADGNDSFDNTWSNRASLTYS